MYRSRFSVFNRNIAWKLVIAVALMYGTINQSVWDFLGFIAVAFIGTAIFKGTAKFLLLLAAVGFIVFLVLN